MPVSKFIRLWSRNKKSVRFLHTCSQGLLSFHDVRDADHLLDRVSDLIKSELPHDAHVAQEAARDAERSQAAQPKYESQAPLQGKGKGKGETQPKGKGKAKATRKGSFTSQGYKPPARARPFVLLSTR